MMKGKFCGLCNETAAAVYCESDSAFLCWSCDVRVHGANFLVARHVRRTLCTKCDEFDGSSVTSVMIQPSTLLCRSCSSESPRIDDHGDVVSVSVCVPSTESITGDDSSPVSSVGSKPASKTRKKRVKIETKKLLRSQAPGRVDDKAEAILVNWCKVMGLNIKLTVRVALHAFNLCLTKLTSMQYRVILASSFWFSLRLRENKVESTCLNYLKRLEQISGVPAKLIVGVERKMELALKDRKDRVDQEEGWAEST